MHAPLNLIQKETSSEVFFCAPDFCGRGRASQTGAPRKGAGWNDAVPLGKRREKFCGKILLFF